MGIIDLLLRPLITSRATERYPKTAAGWVRTRRAPRFDPDLCTDDRSCEAACPTDAISIESVQAGGRRWELDYGKCVFCAECIRVCPSVAIAGTGDYQLAAATRTGVVSEYFLGQEDS